MAKIKIKNRRGKYQIEVVIHSSKEMGKNDISIKRLSNSTRITLPRYKCTNIVMAILAAAGQEEWKPNYSRRTLTLRIPISEQEGEVLKVLIEEGLKSEDDEE